jgi:acyl carrier protein
MPDADAYIDIVRTSISAELAIPLDDIAVTSRLGDLGLDSLDMLKVSFRIEQKLNRKLPVQQWLAEANGGGVSLEDYTVSDLCDRLATVQ